MAYCVLRRSLGLLRLIYRLLLALLVGAVLMVVAAIVAVFAALDDQPAIDSPAPITVQDLSRAKQLFKLNDPRTLQQGEQRQIALSQRDIELLLTEAVKRLPGAGDRVRNAAHVDTQHLHLQAAVRLPANPVGHWLNLRLSLLPQPGHLNPQPPGLLLDRVQAGQVTVPVWLAQWLFEQIEPRLRQRAGYTEARAALNLIASTQVHNRHLVVTLRWDKQLAENLRDRSRMIALSQGERLRIGLYGQWIGDQLRRQGGDASLVELLAPLMRLVQQRIDDDREPQAEMRAAMMALALRVGLDDRLTVQVLGDADAAVLRGLGAGRSTLHKRRDLAQHFIVSAALQLNSGSQFADLVGLWKEVDDAKGGSGFSFPDLLADRAGVRFGELAQANPKLWAMQIATIKRESDLIPPIHALPEGLQEPEFQRRYRNRDNEAWARVQTEINRRLQALPLYAQ